jgi:hypothetical protein
MYFPSLACILLCYFLLTSFLSYLCMRFMYSTVYCSDVLTYWKNYCHMTSRILFFAPYIAIKSSVSPSVWVHVCCKNTFINYALRKKQLSTSLVSVGVKRRQRSKERSDSLAPVYRAGRGGGVSRVDTRISFWNSREKRYSLFRPKILARFLRDLRVKISS